MMLRFFKHNFFKYFLLILISVKIVHFVAENLSSTHEIEMCYEVDADDFENENDEKKEFDETENIHQLLLFNNILNESDVDFVHTLTFDNYLTRYLEFSTPPPELA